MAARCPAMSASASRQKAQPGPYHLMYRGLAYLGMGATDLAQKDFDECLKSYPKIKAEMDMEIAKIKKGKSK